MENVLSGAAQARKGCEGTGMTFANAFTHKAAAKTTKIT